MSNAAMVKILDRWRGEPDGGPDANLLTRFLSEHDEAAFATLVRRHGSLVYGTCQRILGNRADADDAFQAVFFVLARRASTVKRDRSIGPWLYGVALRCAKKLRVQTVRRRLRELSVAKSELVNAAEPDREFWAIIDEEISQLSSPLREAVLFCDFGGQSHSQAAESMGLAKGTITKRLARAHQELANRLRRRGITLAGAALSTAIATQSRASVPVPLLVQTAKQAVAFSMGKLGGSATVKTLAEGIMRSLKFGAFKTWLVVGLLALTLAGGGLMLAGDPQVPSKKKDEQARAKTDAPADTAQAGTMWKENYTVEYRSSLPVSVAFSSDGKTLLTGDTSGEVMALEFTTDDPQWRWRVNVGGSHPAVAYSADQKNVYVTTKDGVRILDAARGRDVARVDVPDSNPIAIGVFPDKTIAADFTHSQIVFGNARGYFIKSWADGKLADTIGTIQTSTVAKGAKPADEAAAPLAVDPKGRSAIMTGPRDAKGKNILWAYVCGDYSEGSPGNRVMVGHAATVVSAAWSKEGGTAGTGDADGRVIVWDAKTMKESRRLELGGRVLALAVSDDGMHTAAYVRGKRGGELYLWETAKPANAMKPIHSEPANLGSESFASLSFSPDGKRLAGCVIDKKWLETQPKDHLVGKVRVWELAAEPKAQPAPKHLFTKQLPKGTSANFVILDNHSILMPSAKEGAIELRDLKDGGTLFRLVLGKFVIGGIKLSSDRRWLAMEQRPVGGSVPVETFDVGVYESTAHKATIPSCSQLLDISLGGKFVAVVKDKQIEVWDTATPKKLKAAPFKHTRIDAARFSPDGKLLAISDRNELVLWRWAEDKHERIDLGRCVGSLAFSPDGKFLAEGPTPWDHIQIRDLETRKVVQTLANGTKQLMNVLRMAYTQGGRMLIACDNITLAKEVAVPHRINLWDTTTGAIAHQIALPAGLPYYIDVTPNGRYMAAILDNGDSGMTLSVWRLDGEKPGVKPEAAPPAASRPR